MTVYSGRRAAGVVMASTGIPPSSSEGGSCLSLPASPILNWPQMQKSLPSSYYTTPEFFSREQSFIFSTEWLCAGREEDLPTPGNHAVLEIANESILVVRTPSGQL